MKRNDRPNSLKTIDFTTKEEQEKLRKQDEQVEEARRLARIKEEKKDEEKRLAEEKSCEEYQKFMQQKYKKKQEQLPFKPSRLIDVDSDLAIMNIETMVTSIKESVEFLEKKLWEIEDALCKDDKKRREALKIRKKKWEAKKH